MLPLQSNRRRCRPAESDEAAAFPAPAAALCSEQPPTLWQADFVVRLRCCVPVEFSSLTMFCGMDVLELVGDEPRES